MTRATAIRRALALRACTAAPGPEGESARRQLRRHLRAHGLGPADLAEATDARLRGWAWTPWLRDLAALWLLPEMLALAATAGPQPTQPGPQPSRELAEALGVARAPGDWHLLEQVGCTTLVPAWCEDISHTGDPG